MLTGFYSHRWWVSTPVCLAVNLLLAGFLSLRLRLKKKGRTAFEPLERIQKKRDPTEVESLILLAWSLETCSKTHVQVVVSVLNTTEVGSNGPLTKVTALIVETKPGTLPELKV